MLFQEKSSEFDSKLAKQMGLSKSVALSSLKVTVVVSTLHCNWRVFWKNGKGCGVCLKYGNLTTVSSRICSGFWVDVYKKCYIHSQYCRIYCTQIHWLSSLKDLKDSSECVHVHFSTERTKETPTPLQHKHLLLQHKHQLLCL